MRLPENNVFKSVKVNKADMLQVVRKNREKHIAEYNEAVEDFKVAVIKVSEQNVKIAKSRLSAAKEGNTNWGDYHFVSVPKEPKSYEAEYNRAIRMLEMSVETDLDVEAQVFNQLALDEWQWKQEFAFLASTYKGMI